MSGGSATYHTTVQRDRYGLYIIYKAKGVELKARAPWVNKRVQSVLPEGTKIRVNNGAMDEWDRVRVRCDLLTEENTPKRRSKEGAPFEMWRVTKDLLAEKILKTRKIAAKKLKVVLTKGEIAALGLTYLFC